SFVDVAVYPTLFVGYLEFWWPGLSRGARWAIALSFIWVLTGLNIAGARLTGWAAVALAAGGLLPVAALTAAPGLRAAHPPWFPLVSGADSALPTLGLGLAVVMWNYSGWDTPSTCLGETRAPEASFRRALFWGLPLIALAYVLPVGAALAATGDWAHWSTGQ